VDLPYLRIKPFHQKSIGQGFLHPGATPEKVLEDRHSADKTRRYDPTIAQEPRIRPVRASHWPRRLPEERELTCRNQCRRSRSATVCLVRGLKGEGAYCPKTNARMLLYKLNFCLEYLCFDPVL